MATSWCLSKIITNKGKEINFTYDTETQYLPTQESCENYNYNLQTALYYYKSKVVNNALRLKTISGDFGRIEFTCSDRLDIKGDSQKLDAICIYNSTNTLIKCYKFDYSYFNNDYSGNPLYANVFKRLKLNKLAEYRSDNPSTNGYNTAYFANIPLNSGYKFDYFEGSFPAKNSKNVDYWGFQNGKKYGENYYIGLKINNVNYTGVKKEGDFNKAIIGTLKKITYPTGGTAEYKYEPNLISSGYFQNNTYEIPPPFTNYLSADLPVYNYYSSNPYQDIYPPSRVYTFQISNPTTLTITGSLENSRGAIDPNYYYRDPNLNPLGRIRKISPTTNTLYTYDCPHLYEFVYGSAPLGQGSEASVPIKQYALDPGTYEFTAYTPPKDVLAYWRLYSETITTTPSPTSNYTPAGIRISEIITDAKRRRFTYQTGMMLTEPVFYYLGRRAGIPNYIASCIVQVSESKAPLSTFNNGNIIAYDWVEEYILDEEDDVSTTRYNFHNNNESDRFDDNFPDSPVYINYTNGLLKSIEKFKTTQGGPKTLVEKEEFEYTSTYSNLIKAFRDRGQKRFDSDILEYYYKIERPLKTKLINTLVTDDNKNMISETNYSYNSKDLLQSTSYNNDNIQITEKLKYAFDFNDALSLTMVNKNMIGIPIESITLKNNIVTQGIKTDYFNSSGLYLPKTIFQTEFNSPASEINYSSYYKPVMNFNSYTAKGKLLESNHTDGPSTYYVWGYNEQYPIAKLENFTAVDAANIQSIITAAINASNADSSLVLEDSLRTALTNLRNAATNAMVTTYTYDPLIGVTSITDIKGYTMFYQYDSFNRLKQIVDATGRIINQNEYNYKQ